MRWSGRLDLSLSGDNHDWWPSGLELCDVIFVDCSSGPTVLTGIRRQQRERVLHLVVIAGTLTLRPEDAGSEESNRFAGTKDHDIETGVTVVYDQQAARWRLAS